jgi:hypothetical protein
MKNTSDFWSIEITSNTNKKYFSDLSEIISGKELLKPYIKLVPDYFPDSSWVESVFLISPQINSMAKSEKEVFFRLNSLYLMLNGIFSLFLNKEVVPQKFRVLFKNYEPGNMRKIDPENEIKILDEVQYSFPFEDEVYIHFENEHNPILATLMLALNNQDLCFILMQLGMENSWVRLYSIWDSIYFTIKRDYKIKNKDKVINFLNLDKLKVNCFEGCANSYGLLFIEARHGNKGWDIPKEIMTKEEAVSLIKEIVQKYIDKLLQTKRSKNE